MAAGEFLIRRNNSENTVLPNAGSNLDSTWDTLAIDQSGTSISYSAGNFQLDTGVYLVMYSEKFDTVDVTNNERIEIQGEIHESGVGVVGGYAQDYIRKSSGQQECIISGAMILEVTSDNTDYFIRFYRTDNSTTGTVNRVPGTGGVQILELDTNDNFGLYSTSASEATSGTTVRTLNINTNDRQDTGFSRSGDIVTVSNAGRYIMTYSLDVSQTATGREDVVGFLERNSLTPVVGSYSYCYLRGADGAQDGAITWTGIVDVAANDTFRLRWSCPTSATITAAAGATLQMWQIPTGGDEAIMEATNGNWNSALDFTFDTLPHIDTASFTATAGNSNIDLDQPDYALCFATLSQAAPDTVQRAYPELRFRLNDVDVNYAAAGVYHRNSGGSGIVAATVAGIVECPIAGDSVEVRITPVGASGTMTNDSGQFSILSLDSLYGPYTFPPAISSFNVSNKFTWGTNNIVISGANFEALQGTGKVEIWDDVVGTIKTVQTIDTWSDTSIQIDSVQGSLPDNTIVYVVVTTDSGSESPPFAVSVGLSPYSEIIDTVGGGSDHHWTFDNTYNDIGNQGPNNCVVTAGTPGFTTNPLTRGRTNAFTVSAQGQRIEPPNSNFINAQAETTRTMGGWIRFTQVQDSFVCFYEEGGGVNNLAFFMGIGGILIAQLADTGDDNVHAYSNFKLIPDRDYHILFRFDYTTTDVFELLIDGVLQSTTFGNPLIATDLDGHSGDIGWGDASGSLEVFGTNVTFPAPVTSYYNDWATWTVFLSTTDVREELFEKGLICDEIITADTEANMQTDINTYNSTTRPDAACAFQIEGSDDGDFELIFTDVVFDDSISVQVQYLGSDTLTLTESGTTKFDANKISTPLGGTVVIQSLVPVKVTVRDITDNSLIEDATVLLEADTGGPLSVGTDIIKEQTDVNGEVETTLVYSSDQPVTGIARQATGGPPFYRQSGIVSTITSEGLDITVFLIRD